VLSAGEAAAVVVGALVSLGICAVGTAIARGGPRQLSEPAAAVGVPARPAGP
jgi:hypothetical protein